MVLFLLPMFSLSLRSTGGRGKQPDLSSPKNNTCETQTIPVVLNQENSNVNTISDRNPNWGNFMPVNNIVNEWTSYKPNAYLFQHRFELLSYNNHGHKL